MLSPLTVVMYYAITTYGCNLHKCIHNKSTNVFVLPPVIQRHGLALNNQSPHAFFIMIPISNSGTFSTVARKYGFARFEAKLFFS